jgi:hypothetical protein
MGNDGDMLRCRRRGGFRGNRMNRIARWALLALLVSAPLFAQNTSAIRPMVAPVKMNTVQVDYKQQFEKERAKNQQLRAENTSLQAQLTEWTGRGRSQVHAYCETPTVSANSAGARNDCAAGGGLTCEPVSGLCRTSAATSAQCAPTYNWCVYGNRCVRTPQECQP